MMAEKERSAEISRLEVAGKSKKKKKTLVGKIAELALVLVLSLLGAIGVNHLPAYMPVDGEMMIHFIDVGQADAAVILCGGQTMMIDGGNAEDSSLIYSYLKNTLGVSHIDYMIATHPHEDHIGGLSGALNACTVGEIFSPVTEYDSKVFMNLVKYAGKQGKTLTVPEVGQTVSLGQARVQFISPAKQYEGTNDQSIVVRITFGATSFLFTGDAEWEAEHDMVDSGYRLDATLLKVGHHGSSSSTNYAFLREVMPEYAIISVGEDNAYGHPTAETLSRLRDVGAEVCRTDEMGSIVVRSDGKELSVYTGDAWKYIEATIAPSASATQAPPAVQRTPSVTVRQESASGAAPPPPNSSMSVYVGDKESKVFHYTGCAQAALIDPANKVNLPSRTIAGAHEYIPCEKCRP